MTIYNSVFEEEGQEEIYNEIRDYQPPYYKEFDEMQHILIEESKLFYGLSNNLGEVRKNLFVQTLSEKGIERWEKILEINNRGISFCCRRRKIVEKLIGIETISMSEIKEIVKENIKRDSEIFVSNIDKGIIVFDFLESLDRNYPDAGFPETDFKDVWDRVLHRLPAHLTFKLLLTLVHPYSPKDISLINVYVTEEFIWLVGLFEYIKVMMNVFIEGHLRFHYIDGEYFNLDGSFNLNGLAQLKAVYHYKSNEDMINQIYEDEFEVNTHIIDESLLTYEVLEITSFKEYSEDGYDYKEYYGKEVW